MPRGNADLGVEAFSFVDRCMPWMATISGTVAQERLFCETKSSPHDSNDTDLRPDSGSAASSGSTCDVPKSSSAVCFCPQLSSSAVSSSALWQYVGSLDSLFETEMPETNYISDFVNQRFSSLRLSHVNLSFASGEKAAVSSGGKPGRSSQNHW